MPFVDPTGTAAGHVLKLWDSVTQKLSDEQLHTLDRLCEEYATEIARMDGRLSRGSLMRLCGALKKAAIPQPPGFLLAFRFVNWPLPFTVSHPDSSAKSVSPPLGRRIRKPGDEEE